MIFIKKIFLGILIVLLLGFIVLVNIEPPAHKPPDLKVTIDGREFTAVKGSYSWESYFAKSSGGNVSPDIKPGQNSNPIKVKRNSQIKFHFEKKPDDDTVQVIQWSNEKDFEYIKLENKKFTVPEKEGQYLYNVTEYWEQGFCSYGFLIDVEGE